MHIAAVNNAVKVMAVLLNYGAAPTPTSVALPTPRFTHPFTGGNVNAVDNIGRTPLFRAVREGHCAAAAVLLANGADRHKLCVRVSFHSYAQRPTHFVTFPLLLLFTQDAPQTHCSSRGLETLLKHANAGAVLKGMKAGAIPVPALEAHGSPLAIAHKLEALVQNPKDAAVNITNDECDAALRAVASLCAERARWQRRGALLATLCQAWQRRGSPVGDGTRLKVAAVALGTRAQDASRAAALAGMLQLRRLSRTRGEWEVVEPFAWATAMFL